MYISKLGTTWFQCLFFYYKQNHKKQLLTHYVSSETLIGRPGKLWPTAQNLVGPAEQRWQAAAHKHNIWWCPWSGKVISKCWCVAGWQRGTFVEKPVQ